MGLHGRYSSKPRVEIAFWDKCILFAYTRCLCSNLDSDVPETGGLLYLQDWIGRLRIHCSNVENKRGYIEYFVCWVNVGLIGNNVRYVPTYLLRAKLERK